ncbi:hypothetical protein PV755_46600 [Streptomyces caniscabiei]|uniref:Uncharacterized protein n=1 Tax=Streptomyces caniscabiei TaxID=2746961 RepID=A0A927QFC3_9ACTN|nr:hypothetical protein [Streptomyces caniscabiei]MBD9723435.1 hypothetical protein [Streptomyces caniscabiei]MDX3516276.1 hypothetical protein [Streptomyces caniscabiei]MDX3725297.1 hypothetical protein [Streptomyces caniscabiei]WEO27005.1 hypothetical protein IHE65_29760 [Streptomyces caniscabiei]
MAAQKYPRASLAAWYQSRYLGDLMNANTGVVHTTEGTALPSYGGGGSAPTFTLVPSLKDKTVAVYQHFDVDRSARALVNKAGGVQTNTLNCVQVELTGTCDPKTRAKWIAEGRSFVFWPEAPDWALLEFARLVHWLSDEHGVPLASTVTWKAYPGSYGANGVRLSGQEWTDYYGWCGHQHVPENDHGDPGNFPMGKVLTMAREKAWETKPPAPKPPTVEERLAVLEKTVKAQGARLAVLETKGV